MTATNMNISTATPNSQSLAMVDHWAVRSARYMVVKWGKCAEKQYISLQGYNTITMMQGCAQLGAATVTESRESVEKQRCVAFVNRTGKN